MMLDMDGGVEPEFNSSIDYLKRIGWLMRYCHIASVNDEDYTDWLWVIEQLHIEIDPRLTDEERWQCDVIRDYAYGGKHERNNIREYHLLVNRLAHLHGLIMKDKESLPGVMQG